MVIICVSINSGWDSFEVSMNKTDWMKRCIDYGMNCIKSTSIGMSV